MDENNNIPKTPLITPPAEDSEDEETHDQEPMVFNFDGPQSNEEVRDQALQESASFNTRSQSSKSSQNDGSREHISFNFGPQPVEAPEAEFIATFAAGSRRPQMPAGARELAASINNRRRAATNREFRGGATAYIDEDESGTYDPKRARRTPSSPSRPAKRIKTCNAVSEDGAPKPKKPAKQIGFRYEMVVKLKFQSKKALDYLRTLPAGPYGSQSSNADEEAGSDDSGYGGSFKRKREVRRPTRLGATVTRSDGLTIDVLTSGHPQRRGCRCCFEQGNDDCTLIEHPDEYPCEACDDADADCVLIITPKFKKACLRCKGKRRNCSYSLDGGKSVNACDLCEEEGVTCCAEPLTEPSMIRRFANLPARVKPKPAPSTVTKGPVRERMYVSCNQCRSTGKRCTNRGKADPGPCSNCRKAGQACKFVHQLTRTPQVQAFTPKTKKTSAFSSKYSSKSVSSTPPRDRMGTPHSPNTLTATLYSELEKKNTRKAEKLIAKGKLYSPSHPLYQSLFRPRNSKSRSKSFSKKILQISPKLIGRTLGIAHIHITTSFCHPITFNYVPDPLLKNPCSWCDNPFYGLWGLASTSGPRRVEGFYYANGGGFEEVFGGFSELGYSRSVMCIACTYARVRITQCPAHRLRALDVKSGEFDLDVLSEEKWGMAVRAYEVGDLKGAELVRRAKWCSICPAAAALKCCSPQLFDENGEPVQQHGGKQTDPGCEGCGLLLCEDCAELMGKLIKCGARTGSRQLDAMVTEVKRNKWRFTEGVRADAEFLTSGGELLRRIGEGIGASEGRIDDEGEVRVLKAKGEGGRIAGGGEGERKRGGWMNGKGNGKENADTAEQAWTEYRAGTGRASTTGNVKGKGKMASNGDSAARNGSTRPASSTISSASSKSKHNTKVEHKPSNGAFSESHHHLSSKGDNRSMVPPSSRNSSTTNGQWNSTSHSYFGSERGVNGGGSGVQGGGSSNGNGYAYAYGQRGIKREREVRGEIMFGGFLKERKEDVEKAFRGQMGVIDLTDDE